MKNSPFAFFRKYQRVGMVALTVMAMFSFVFLGTMNSPSGSGSANASSEVEVKIRGGNLTAADLSHLRYQRSKINEFIAHAVNAALTSDETDKIPDWMLPDVIFNNQFGIEWRPYPLDSNENLIWSHVMRLEARRLGLVVTDPMVTSHIERMTGKKLTAQQFQAAMKRVDLREKEIYDMFREELLARNAWSIARPMTDHTPQQYWKYYRQMKVRQNLEVAALPVAEFAKAVKDPGDAVLEQFFKEHKLKYPGQYPNFASPGFRQPDKVRVQYLMASYEEVEKKVPEISDKEVVEYYEKNKDLYREIEKTEAPGIGENDPLNPELAPEIAPPPALPEKVDPATETPAKDVSKDKPAEKPAEKPAVKPADTPQEKPAADKPQEKPAEKPPVEEKKPADEKKPVEEGQAEKSGEDPPAAKAEPVAKEPVAKEPVAKEPASEQPAESKPAAAKPEVKAPTETKPDVEKPKDAAPPASKPAAANPAAAKPAEAKATEGAPAEKPADSKKSAAAAPALEKPEALAVKYKPLTDELKDDIREGLLRQKTQDALKKIGTDVLAQLDGRNLRYNMPIALAGDTAYIDFNEDGKLDSDEPSVESKTKFNPEELDKIPAEVATALKQQVIAIAGKDLQAVGKKFGMQYTATGLVSGKEIDETAGLGKVIDEGDNPFQPGGAGRILNVLFGKEILFNPEFGKDSDLDGQDIYVYWKAEQVKSHVPKFKDAGIREQVWAAWRLHEAYPLALQRADELAKVARGQGKLEVAFKGQTVTNVKGGMELLARDTADFSWKTAGIPSPDNMMMDTPAPVLSTVAFVENAGDEFMQVACEDLGVGDVGFAPNSDHAYVYVMRVINREPKPGEETERMRETFMKDRLFSMSLGTRTFSSAYSHIASEDATKMIVDWMESLKRQYQIAYKDEEKLF